MSFTNPFDLVRETAQLHVACSNELASILKKLGKRDVTTRLKGLEELAGFVEEIKEDDLIYLRSQWIKIYWKLARDPERRIRLTVHQVFLSLAASSSRTFIAPIIKELAFPWLAALHDPLPSASSLVRRAFETVFAGDKARELCRVCFDSIMKTIRETIGFRAAEEYELAKLELSSEDAAYFDSLNISMTVSVLAYILDKLDVDFLNEHRALLLEIFGQGTLCSWMKPKNSIVSPAFYRLFGVVSIKMPVLFEKDFELFATGLLGVALAETSASNAQSMFDSLVVFSRSFPAAWFCSNAESKKPLTSMLFEFLRGGLNDLPSSQFARLPELLLAIPLTPEQAAKYVANLFKATSTCGFDKERVKCVLLAYVNCLSSIKTKCPDYYDTAALDLFNTLLESRPKPFDALPISDAIVISDVLSKDARARFTGEMADRLDADLRQAPMNDPVIQRVMQSLEVLDRRDGGRIVTYILCNIDISEKKSIELLSSLLQKALECGVQPIHLSEGIEALVETQIIPFVRKKNSVAEMDGAFVFIKYLLDNGICAPNSNAMTALWKGSDSRIDLELCTLHIRHGMPVASEALQEAIACASLGFFEGDNEASFNFISMLLHSSILDSARPYLGQFLDQCTQYLNDYLQTHGSSSTDRLVVENIIACCRDLPLPSEEGALLRLAHALSDLHVLPRLDFGDHLVDSISKVLFVPLDTSHSFFLLDRLFADDSTTVLELVRMHLEESGPDAANMFLRSPNFGLFDSRISPFLSELLSQLGSPAPTFPTSSPNCLMALYFILEGSHSWDLDDDIVHQYLYFMVRTRVAVKDAYQLGIGPDVNSPAWDLMTREMALSTSGINGKIDAHLSKMHDNVFFDAIKQFVTDPLGHAEAADPARSLVVRALACSADMFIDVWQAKKASCSAMPAELADLLAPTKLIRTELAHEQMVALSVVACDCNPEKYCKDFAAFARCALEADASNSRTCLILCIASACPGHLITEAHPDLLDDLLSLARRVDHESSSTAIGVLRILTTVLSFRNVDRFKDSTDEVIERVFAGLPMAHFSLTAAELVGQLLSSLWRLAKTPSLPQHYGPLFDLFVSMTREAGSAPCPAASRALTKCSIALRSHAAFYIASLDAEVLFGLLCCGSISVQLAARFMFLLILDRELERVKVSAASWNEKIVVEDIDPMMFLPALTLLEYLRGLDDADDEISSILPKLFAYEMFLALTEGCDTPQVKSAYCAFFKTRLCSNVVPLLASMMGWLDTDGISRRDLRREEFVVYDVEVLADVHHADLVGYAAHLYYRTLKAFATVVGTWWGDLKTRQLATILETNTKTYFSPRLIQREIDRVRKSSNYGRRSGTLEGFSLLCQQSSTTTCIKAIYKLEEFSMEIELSFSDNYPLKPIEIHGGQRFGISEAQWRTWMLASQAVFKSSNYSILDGLNLWRQNIDRSFDGIEPCAVCYCILNPTDRTLPTPTCRTCKHKFHAACLYKWFKTGGQTKCPLCRALF